MAFNAGTVKGTLDLNVQKFKKSVQSATTGFRRMGGAAKTAGGDVKRFGVGAKGMAVGLLAAVGGIIAIQKAFHAVTGVLTRASKAQREYESSVRGLTAALITQGAPAIAETTRQLEGLATTVQDLTDIGDTEVLDTARALAAFGADPSKLQQYTRAVLDTSKALGLDAKTAARSFGQALAGNAATLGRYLPQIRGVTQEQLKAGIAFDIAGKAFNGFAEIAARSTEGSLTRLGNAANDVQKRLGAAFNEYLGSIAESLVGSFRKIADQFGEGTKGFEQLKAAMRAGFEFALSGVRLLIDGFYNLRIGFKGLQVLMAYWQQAWVTIGTTAVEVYAKVTQVISGIIAGVAQFVASIPFLSDGIKQSVQGVADFFKNLEKGAKGVDDEMDNLQAAAAGVVEDRKRELAGLKAQHAAIQANVQGENAILNAVTGVYNLKVEETTFERAIREHKEQQIANEQRLARLAAERQEAIQKRLQHLREINGVSGTAYKTAEQLKEATEGIAGAAGAAASNAGEMADEFGRAAGNASAAASAAASAGAAAGGGEVPTLSASRHVVSSTALDFSDPFRAVALAQSAGKTLGRISSGGKNPYIGMTGVNAARAFYDAVSQEAKAAVDKAIAEYTATILSELNQAGILDPTERSRIIRERIAEAQRLGVVPSAAGLSASSIGSIS